MKSKKTPYSGAHSLQLIPISKVSVFAVVQSKAIMQYTPGDYKLPFTPGTFTPDIQEEEAEGGIQYQIGHSFNVGFDCLENDQRLQLLKSQKVIAIYTNEAGQQVVSGSKQYPLNFSYIPLSGYFQCKLTGVTTSPEAFI